MMNMSRTFILFILLYISCSIHAIAQTDYYYYHGNKIPLTLNESKVVVSIPKDCCDIIERFQANVKTLAMIKDETFGIFVIPRSDFESLTSLDYWSEDAKSVILTSSYFTEENEEVVATPYLNVKLKKEEDSDLLTAYAEDYKLRIVYKSPFTLWYILSTTQYSEKKSLECANEIYESGAFAESIPDLVSVKTDATAVRYITTETAKEFSTIYALQGRRLTDTPQRGMYIRDGKKYVVK